MSTNPGAQRAAPDSLTRGEPDNPARRQRVALVGTGGRGLSFVEAVVSSHRDRNELVAFCDPSATRREYYNELLARRWNAGAVASYPADEFERMCHEQRPDVVVVCSPDRTHDEYIVRALEYGADVVTEKPIAIDRDRCARILAAVKKSGRKVRVAFNYRWGQYRTKVRELLAQQTIGRVHSVTLEYLLDTQHGADYFRRWHSHRSESGGLFVHKATHHFDLVNWWLDAIPETVYAHGDLVFYGQDNAEARGDGALARYERYTDVAESAGDPFRLDLNETESFRRLYRDAERETGYIRDRNVFRSGIDIFDQMNALVRYRSGQVLNYSLVAYSPREGMRVSFNGDRGRIEYHEFVGSHMNRAVVSNDYKLEKHGSAEVDGEWIKVYPHFKPSYRIDLPPDHRPHGGADVVMHRYLFGEPDIDPLGRAAGHEQGMASALVGIAANESSATGKPVRISDLLPLGAAGAVRLGDLI